MYDKEKSWTDQEALRLEQTIDIHFVKDKCHDMIGWWKLYRQTTTALMKTARPSEELLWWIQLMDRIDDGQKSCTGHEII